MMAISAKTIINKNAKALKIHSVILLCFSPCVLAPFVQQLHFQQFYFDGRVLLNVLIMKIFVFSNIISKYIFKFVDV